MYLACRIATYKDMRGDLTLLDNITKKSTLESEMRLLP